MLSLDQPRQVIEGHPVGSPHEPAVVEAVDGKGHAGDLRVGEFGETARNLKQCARKSEYDSEEHFRSYFCSSGNDINHLEAIPLPEVREILRALGRAVDLGGRLAVFPREDGGLAHGHGVELDATHGPSEVILRRQPVAPDEYLVLVEGLGRISIHHLINLKKSAK